MKKGLLRQLRVARLVARRFPTTGRRRLVESGFGETPFKFDTPDSGRDRRTDRRAFHASRGYTAASFSVRSSTLGTKGIERIHACCSHWRCGKEMGREEGWKSVNERSSVLRRSVDFAENAWNREKFTADRRCAYSSSPSHFFTSIHYVVSRFFLIEFGR